MKKIVAAGLALGFSLLLVACTATGTPGTGGAHEGGGTTGDQAQEAPTQDSTP